MGEIPSQLLEYARLERKSAATGLTPRELQLWSSLKQRLALHFSPGVGSRHADRRESLRVPVRLRVSFSSREDLQQSLMTNLSRNGVFIQTPHLVDIGTCLTLSIQVDETGERIEAPASVVSHNVGPHLEHGRSGMGMRFLDLPPEAEKKLAELYQKGLNDQARRSKEGESGA